MTVVDGLQEGIHRTGNREAVIITISSVAKHQHIFRSGNEVDDVPSVHEYPTQSMSDDSVDGTLSLDLSKAETESSRIKHRRMNEDEIASQVTMAQSFDVLRRSLRGGDSPSARRSMGLTETKAPHFQVLHKRPSVKSTAEQEMEEMAHAFKAKPVRISEYEREIKLTPVSQRDITRPEPFHFVSEERVSMGPELRPSKDREEQLEIEECRNKFRAREMPNFDHVAPLPEIRSQPVTVPKPFHLRIDERLKSSSTRFSHVEEVAEDDNAKRPRTTHSSNTADLKQPVMFKAGTPPTLRTEARATSRLKTRDRHRRKAEEIKREKQFEALRRQREAHERKLQEVQTQRNSVVEVKPFHLESLARHEAYKRQMAERLEQEELEKRRQTGFRARPFKSPRSDSGKSTTSSTTPLSAESPSRMEKPFMMDAMARHKAYQQQFAERLEQERLESRKQAEFHARPLKSVKPFKPTRKRASPAVSKEALREASDQPERTREKVSLAAFVSTPLSPDLSTNTGVKLNEKSTIAKERQLPVPSPEKSNQEATPRDLPETKQSNALSGQEVAVHAEGGVEKRSYRAPILSSPDPMAYKGNQDDKAKKRGQRPRQSTARKQATTHRSPQDTGSTARGSGVKTTGVEKRVTKAAVGGLPRGSRLSSESQSNRSQEGGGSTSTTMLLFVGLCIFRVLNTLLVYSYFDPDEFWQTMEPAYCAAFVDGSSCSGHTWEWKRRAPTAAMNLVESSLLGPARSYLSVLPTFLYFILLKVLEADTTWLVSRGPMVLAAVTVAAPVDLAVWHAAQWLDRPNEANSKWILPAWSLFSSLTSWFSAYSVVRTFANGQEGLFLILAIVLVGPELLGNTQKGSYYLRAAAAFMLGGLSITIRVTSIAAFVPLGILLALRQRSLVSKVGFLLFICAIFGLMGIFVGMLVDRFFFGFWTLPFLGNFHFNVILDNADLYGSHPWHWYFTAGLPAVSGLLIPFLWYDFATILDRPTYGRRNLWVVVLSYLVAMSLNGHKEFRYIYPVLPLVCLLTAQHVRTVVAGTGHSRLRTLVFGTLFLIPNVIAVLYLGLFHQTGPIAVNHAIVEAAQENLARSQRTTYSIHYLTGACHSTPLHSHLHAPPIHFDTWSLDCSPDCRSDPDAVCEYERFDRDPSRFVQEAYSPICLNEEEEEEVGQIQPDWPVPDFLVTFSSYADRLAPQLGDLGLHVTDRFPQHLTGVKLGASQICFSGCDEAHKYQKVFDWLSVTMEEVVLYRRRTET